ncbi:hypothetical protein M405DRAFT_932050 [Rhizopogon salebrosus TDB-379]|nr:hypothetical protein M405DRAFT_932050 [Rhizopogon salebrosus TDB-379]
MVVIFDRDEATQIGMTIQHTNFAFFAIAGLWVYDFALTIGEEVEFILRARWQIGKLLYLVCRYLPFAMVFLDIFRIVQPQLSVGSCTTCFAVIGFVGGIELCCAEALFVLRIWVLSSRRRWTLAVMLCNYIVLLIAMVVITKVYNSSSIVQQSPIPQLASCYSHSESHIIVYALVLLVIGEIEIFGFMLYRSWKLYGEHGNNLPLVRILTRHNAFYFACGLCFSTLVIVIKLTLPASFGDVILHFQIFIHGILATRMHRELWNAGHHRRAASNESFPLVVFAGPPL